MASQVTIKLQLLLWKIQQIKASAIIEAFKTVTFYILKLESEIVSYIRKHKTQKLQFWIDKNSLSFTNSLSQISKRRFSQFVSKFQKMAEEYSTI